MSLAPTVKDLVERNKTIAQTYEPKPNFAEFEAFGWLMPKTLVITCADMRMVPEHFLGLKGADAVVFRNVCGHAAQEMSPLLALDSVVNFNEIMIVHHTDCGANMFTEDGFRWTLKQRVGGADAEIDALPYGGSIQGQELVTQSLSLLDLR